MTRGRIAALLLLLAGAALAYCLYPPRSSESAVSQPTLSTPREADAAQVRQFCGTACHPYPPPDSFPRSAWRREVQQAYELFGGSKLQSDFPSLESVALYYENRAPEKLKELKFAPPAKPPSVSLRRKDFRLPDYDGPPAVSNINLVHLFDERRLDILVCEMRLGRILVLQPYTSPPAWRTLYSHGPDQGFNPAHAEVVDLDGDGKKDVIVANLGYPEPTDAECGSVVWLRGVGDGKFEPHTLLQGVGRVADVQAGDFRGTGKIDLIVAEFGWRNTGGITYLENDIKEGKNPSFVARKIDERNGPIHVPVADLNGDGKLDFVALISQEHETIVAFLNEGGGRFRKETIWAAPHPAYGSSGIQLVDLNDDGKLDVLYSNGDSLDPPYLLKPYHGVQWLENRGRSPFVHHHLTEMYGVARAVAADFTGRGKKDILAVSLLLADAFPQRKEMQLDSIVLLEQTAKGEYVRHSLEKVDCDHFTCAVADLYGDGGRQLVTGSCSLSGTTAIDRAVTIWEKR